MLPLDINGHRPVQPLNTPAAYIGGKNRLAKKIVSIINRVPHRTYAEPFVGMGGVFLKRTMSAPAEVINDYNRDVANLFRILQRHYVAFLDLMKFQLTTRREFERLKSTDPQTLTDLENAVRFLYLQRLAFGGKVKGQNFGVDPAGAASFNILQLAPLLEQVHERLSGVVIECLPWKEFIGRYDTPETLFYLDPPYWGAEGCYGAAFGRGEFEQLSAVLKGIHGRFILSINDVPEIRQIFAWARLEEVELVYSVAGGDHVMDAKELIITPPERKAAIKDDLNGNLE